MTAYKETTNVHIGRVIDVVKTRLQVEARKGQTTYKGLADTFTKICMSHWLCHSDPLI
jgi:hypothetical protein